MAARAVKIVTEVAAVDRTFDYSIGDEDRFTVGDRVRVDFNHRSVRGWVVGDATVDGELKPVRKWLGLGPPPELVSLLDWAARRWYAPWARFLASASPARVVTTLPSVPAKAPLAENVAATAVHIAPGVIHLAPTLDPLGLVLAAYDETRRSDGSLLVIVPYEGWASRLRGRLEQRGCPVASGDSQWERARAGWPVVVGSRGTALAPVPRVSGAVVIDADDEALRSSAAPTWDVVSMLRERCSRDGAPVWFTSMLPSAALLEGGTYQRGPDAVGGWPRVQPIDRRDRDPHEGVLAPGALDAAHRALAGSESVAVVVISQRLGAGRLVACSRCGELARCAICAQAEREDGDALACADDHERRARFCRECGSTKLKNVISGVKTVARDVGDQLGQPVTTLTAAAPGALDGGALTRVVVGTEAVLTRVRRCAVVIFADFDQYLLAPRVGARHAAVSAVGRAGRLVGSRREGRGHVVIQTRRVRDVVVDALVSGQFDALIEDEVATARLLALPPYGAIASVSGDGALEFVSGLSSPEISVSPSAEGFTLRARDVDTLTSALRAAERPGSRIRVAVQ